VKRHPYRMHRDSPQRFPHSFRRSGESGFYSTRDLEHSIWANPFEEPAPSTKAILAGLGRWNGRLGNRRRLLDFLHRKDIIAIIKMAIIQITYVVHPFILLQASYHLIIEGELIRLGVSTSGGVEGTSHKGAWSNSSKAISSLFSYTLQFLWRNNLTTVNDLDEVEGIGQLLKITPCSLKSW